MLGVVLIFDYLFYVHMSKRGGMLHQNVATYWSGCVAKDWSVDDIENLLGKPNVMTSNFIGYTAYDFGFSKIPLPFMEIVLSGSDNHFHRHEILFFYDTNSIIYGCSDSESTGLRESQRERDLRIKRFEFESKRASRSKSAEGE